MRNEELQLTAYRVIRREVNCFERTTNDAELGNFVRGVVALQTELYSRMENECSENTAVSQYENKNVLIKEASE